MRIIHAIAVGAALFVAAGAAANAQTAPDPMASGAPSPGATGAPLPGPAVTAPPTSTGATDGSGYDTLRYAKSYQFVPHAPFYSLTFNAPTILDPQVFVVDAGSAAGPGPEGIVHAAGVRNAYASDANARSIENAQGADLHLLLGSWIGARGSAILAPVGTGEAVVAAFNGLVPQGTYSLFVAHFGPTVTATALDATGTTNTFTAGADGSATIRVMDPVTITRGDAVTLVYHSDGTDHGLTRGDLGLNAHTQLILRIP